MSRRLTVQVPYILLPLLAILFIAVGMPLIHPVLHSSLEHHQISVGHGAGQFLSMPDKDKAYECPICDFLATIQLYDTSSELIITEKEPIGTIFSIYQFCLVKTCLILSEPRAPPVFTS